MGCVCCSLSSFISILLQALERVTLCTVCAMLVCCILCTLLAVLVIGVGIGYHYCEVENAVASMAEAAKQATAQNENRRSGSPLKPSRENMVHSVNSAVKRGFARQLGRRDRAGASMPSNNNTINDIILGRNHSTRLEGIALGSNHTDTMWESYTNASLQLKRIILEPNYTETSSRDKRDVTFDRNLTDISLPVYQDLALQHFTNSSLPRRNHVNNTRRLKRDLSLHPRNNRANDMTFNFTNDTILNVTNTALNDTNAVVLYSMNYDNVTYEFDVDVPQNSIAETLEETSDVLASNVSINDAISLRQNCTLLNFFSRFFQF